MATSRRELELILPSGLPAEVRDDERGQSRYRRREVTPAGGLVLGADQASSTDRILVAGHSDFTYAVPLPRADAQGAVLYATNREATFPMPDGPWPATGAILAAVETALGATATCVGKPEPEIFHAARTLLGSETAQVAAGVVGDRLDTDIVGSHRAGLAAVLVRA